jgi:probable phosphoglycerate mutase
MIRVALIRHAPTVWNAEHRLQGRTDIPLSAEGERWAATWRLPDELAGFDAWCSPLTRTRQTAALLGLAPRIDPLLIEASWGEWEGSTLADLRTRPDFGEAEHRGLDLSPPGGEAARAVQRRLIAWLSTLTAPALAITHNGVLRAAYALATGWTMLEKPREKLRPASAHLYAWDGARLSVERLNVPLVPDEAP